MEKNSLLLEKWMGKLVILNVPSVYREEPVKLVKPQPGKAGFCSGDMHVYISQSNQNGSCVDRRSYKIFCLRKPNTPNSRLLLVTYY